MPEFINENVFFYIGQEFEEVIRSYPQYCPSFLPTTMSAPHNSRPSTGMASKPTTGRPWTGRSRPTTARPWTGQSRPDTARPQTAVSTKHESSCVISIFEGRGVAHEVGIAALDRDTGRAMLVQVHDNPF
jgi:hypothetical protein